MKIISFANLKGGVGKSNSVLQIASLLANENKNILILDMDSQGNSGNNFGINKRRKDIGTTRDIFEKEARAEDLIITTKYRHISIIPSNISLLATEYKIISKAGRELFLRRFLSRNKLFLESHFDYILIDCNPSFNILNQNAYIVSDSIILVSDCSYNSLDGAEMFIEMWTDTRQMLGINKDNVDAILINKFDKRTKMDKEILEAYQVHPIFKPILLETVVPLSVKFREGELEEKALKGLVMNTYEKIVKELKRRGVL